MVYKMAISECLKNRKIVDTPTPRIQNWLAKIRYRFFGRRRLREGVGVWDSSFV